jgi:hypothetical protein
MDEGHTAFLWEGRKENDRLEDRGVDGIMMDLTDVV